MAQDLGDLGVPGQELVPRPGMPGPQCFEIRLQRGDHAGVVPREPSPETAKCNDATSHRRWLRSGPVRASLPREVPAVRRPITFGFPFPMVAGRDAGAGFPVHRRSSSVRAQPGQGPKPHVLDAVLGPAHAAGHIGKAQSFKLPQNDHFAIIFRKVLQGIGQQHGLLAPNCLLTGRALGRDQALIQGPGRMVQLVDERALQPQVAALGAQVVPHLVGQNRADQPPNPGQELSLGAAPEQRDLAVDLQPDLLEQVLDVHLAAQPATDLEPDQETHVVAVPLQQSPQRRSIACLGQDQEELGIES